MKYTITYGLDSKITFTELEQATIFTLGLTAKGVGYTIVRWEHEQ